MREPIIRLKKQNKPIRERQSKNFSRMQAFNFHRLQLRDAFMNGKTHDLSQHAKPPFTLDKKAIG